MKKYKNIKMWKEKFKSDFSFWKKEQEEKVEYGRKIHSSNLKKRSLQKKEMNW